ncbi:DUF3800 domain-containing protein [Azospirillum brasilense]|uniref:DUF3800 domain-containing protein n=1 Tax=Azospirillum brasilense TaxID=192 RepID=UPI0013B3D2CB|nr:DUF3800 domain-containing protein [Azospirillum brasilense]
MQIYFMDESGTAPQRPTKQQRYFVIGGVIIPSNLWHEIADEMTNLKKNRRIRGEIKWRYFAPNNDDASNPLKGRPQAERDEFRAELFGLITKRASVRIICTVTSIEAAFEMRSVNNADDLYHLTYKTSTERFQYYLQDLSKTVGRKENGIIVCDHRGPRDDKRLRQQHQKLLYSSGEHITRYSNLVEGLFIAPSHMSVGIQLSDLVAGAVWRHYEKGDDRWFGLIKDSLRQGPNGNPDGYGVIKTPKSNWR